MKFNTKVLALSLVNASVWGTSAFQAPKVHSHPSTELYSAPFFATPSGFQESTMLDASSPNGPQIANASLMTPGAKNVGRSSEKVLVQGGSLRTWTFTSSNVERVNVVLRTDGRPMNADIDLWQGPDNTPQKMAVYIEDGSMRPFDATIESPRGDNTVAVRNTASLEYPLFAAVEAGIQGQGNVADKISDKNAARVIQGGALKTYSFAAAVGSVQILLETDGRPLNSRIELLQGPNNNKQVIDIYTEDGYNRPFYCVVKTPGTGNVVRIVNTAPMEYPLMCAVEPYEVEPGYDRSGMESGVSFPTL
jgi:hypothetical protein